MMRRSVAAALVIASVFLATSCKGGEGVSDDVTRPPSTAAATQGTHSAATPFFANDDLSAYPLMSIRGDIGYDVTNPKAVAEESSDVITGTVVGIVETRLNNLGLIDTLYEVEVGEVLKGDLKPLQRVEVLLPGGTMTAGEFIKQAELLGISDQVFVEKAPGLIREHGGDPDEVQSLLDADPAEPVTQNFGSNPASRILNDKVQPDEWVYFLGNDGKGLYYGTAAFNSLMFLKDGNVHSLFVDPNDAKAPRSTLEDLKVG